MASTSTSSPSSRRLVSRARVAVAGMVEPSARFEMGAALDKGTCQYMEDAVVLAGSIRGSDLIDGAAVIDGHGHALAKAFSMSFVQAAFKDEVERAVTQSRLEGLLGKDTKREDKVKVMKKVMTEAYRSIHSKGQTYFEGHEKTETPGGSCMISALLVDRELVVANAGDSFALLVSYSKEKSRWIGLSMSETHSCSNKTELKRAKDSGAEIQWVNGESLEVLNAGEKVDEKRGDKGFLVGASSEGRYRIQPTRSLLDYGFPGNICDPTLRHRSLTDSDLCLLLCSDGVSDNLSNKRIVEIVSKAWRDKKTASEMTRDVVKAAIGEAPAAVDRIDNTSAAVIYFKEPLGEETGQEIGLEEWTETKKGEKGKDKTETKKGEKGKDKTETKTLEKGTETDKEKGKEKGSKRGK